MAHLPYADLSEAAVQPLLARIERERGSILHLYHMLLHSPPLAEGWLGFLTQVRQKLKLDGGLRELAIVQVAHLNGTRYEAEQHEPIAMKQGIATQQLAALPDWQTEPSFSAAQRAVLRLADTMTREVHVPAAQIAAVRRFLDDRETVELVGTIAAYNMVSRFLEALQIHSSDERPTE